jgi:hypothetical protein
MLFRRGLALEISLGLIQVVVNLQVEYNCALIKVDWLAACIAL